MTGDIHKDASDQFHMILGYCIAQWAYVERELFMACWMALDCPRRQAAIVYYGAPSVSARLRLVSSLVRAALPKPERKNGGHQHPSIDKWKEITKRFEAALSIRTWAAHRPASLRYETVFNADFDLTEPGEYDEEGNYREDYAADFVHYPTFELHMSSDEQLHAGDGKKLSIAEHELKDHYHELNELAEELNRFCHDELLPHCGEPRTTWSEGRPSKNRAQS